MSDLSVRLNEDGVLTIATQSNSECAGFALKEWWGKFSKNIPGATLRILIYNGTGAQVFEGSTDEQSKDGVVIRNCCTSIKDKKGTSE